MFDQLWIDADLATLEPSGDDPWGVVPDGALGVRGDRIAWVGERENLPGPPQSLAPEVRSAGGGWITPGLIDCHTHAVFGGNRAQEFAARLAGESYEALARKGGGILQTVEATRRASTEELAGGGWITPGLIDCHTHAVFGGNRAQEFAARLAGESYESLARKGGGILSTVEATRNASTAELAAGAARRLRVSDRQAGDRT